MGEAGTTVQLGLLETLVREALPYRLVVWKQECKPTKKGLLDACSNTCFSVCTQSMSCNRHETDRQTMWRHFGQCDPRAKAAQAGGLL